MAEPERQAEQEGIQPTQVCDESEPEACEAETCRDSAREWTPMPVWLGGCMAFTGMYVIGAVLPDLVCRVNQPPAGLVILGSLLGTFVFQAVVPTTGYAVLLVPGCLAGTVVFGISPWLPSSWSGLVVTGQGAIVAAIWCGCSGLVGESFVNSCQHNSQAVILMIGSMAAAAVGLVTGVVSTVVSPTAGSLINAFICFVTILWLRKIPSLLVSHRRENAVSPEEATRMLSESFGVSGGSAK